MAASPFGSKYAKLGVDLVFEGDHQHHHVDISDDVTATWDSDSLVMTIRLDERHANDLYWQLLEIIPKLRKDRR